MAAPKHIVIKHEDLHPEVKGWVANVLQSRHNRLYVDYKDYAPGGFYTWRKHRKIPLGAGIGSAIGFFTGAGVGVPEHVAKGMGYGVLAGALVGGLTPYKLGSRDVRRSTGKVGKAIKETGKIDLLGQFKVAEVRKTHPFAFVNRKGDLVLVPKTRFQRALASAQKTFLKHVVPGRYRIHL